MSDPPPKGLVWDPSAVTVFPQPAVEVDRRAPSVIIPRHRFNSHFNYFGNVCKLVSYLAGENHRRLRSRNSGQATATVGTVEPQLPDRRTAKSKV
jgi:hypothetical protein